MVLLIVKFDLFSKNYSSLSCFIHQKKARRELAIKSENDNAIQSAPFSWPGLL
jgi:hypothetical protein